jgi:Host cell surface-exposed lipoprotein
MNWFKKHKVLSCVLGFILLMIIIGSAAGGGKSSTIKTNNNSATNTAAKKESESKPADNVPVEYKSALNQAGSYAKTMHMSKQGVYDQLVSEFGGKFSEAAAQYAIDNVKADWNANALAKAKDYQKSMSMSPAAIHDQLTSSAGEKFTAAEADYAIQHLND